MAPVPAEDFEFKKDCEELCCDDVPTAASAAAAM